MHTSWKLTAALAASFGIAGAAAAAPAATPATTAPAPAAAKPAAVKASSLGDHAQIQALEKGFAAALSAKNVGRIMSYYAHDGLFVFDVTPPRQHVGWADYKKDWQDFMGEVPGPLSFTLSDLAITVVGPVAWSHSIQSMHYAAKDGAKKEFAVRVTDVYRKLAGKWLIVQEHVSVPVDLDTGKPDLMSKP
jgi:ketosteroid isomerase-like protein